MSFLRPQIDENNRARLSAPGYLDCTDWVDCGGTLEAIKYLADTYGDEFDNRDWEELIGYDSDLVDYLNGYFLAVGFTATDYNGNPLFPCQGEFLDYYDTFDILKKIPESELSDFYGSAIEFYIESVESGFFDDSTDWGLVGHNFHLSRNGHGSGFFDSDFNRRDELQKLSKKFGELELT